MFIGKQTIYNRCYLLNGFPRYYNLKTIKKCFDLISLSSQQDISMDVKGFVIPSKPGEIIKLSSKSEKNCHKIMHFCFITL